MYKKTIYSDIIKHNLFDEKFKLYLLNIKYLYLQHTWLFVFDQQHNIQTIFVKYNCQFVMNYEIINVMGCLALQKLEKN